MEKINILSTSNKKMISLIKKHNNESINQIEDLYIDRNYEKAVI